MIKGAAAAEPAPTAACRKLCDIDAPATMSRGPSETATDEASSGPIYF